MFLSKSEIENTKLQERIAANFKLLYHDGYYVLRQTVSCYNVDQETDGELQVADGHGVLLKYVCATKGSNIEYDDSNYVVDDNTYLVFNIVVYDEELAKLTDGDTVCFDTISFKETMVEEIDEPMSQTFEVSNNNVTKIKEEIETNRRKYNNTAYALIPIILGLLIVGLSIPTVIMKSSVAFGIIIVAIMLFAPASAICISCHFTDRYILPEFFNKELNIKYQKLKDDAKNRYTDYAHNYNFDVKYLKDEE